jgi:hypothetical protein
MALACFEMSVAVLTGVTDGDALRGTAESGCPHVVIDKCLADPTD